MSDTPPFNYTVVQGKIRGRAKIVKFQGSGGLILTDRTLAVDKRLIMAQAVGGDIRQTNRLVQLYGSVEKGDDDKQAYVVRFTHVQCPAGLDALVPFLEKALGMHVEIPDLDDLDDRPTGPVTYRLDTKLFEMGGATLGEKRGGVQHSYRATPMVRRMSLDEEAELRRAGKQPTFDPLPAAEPAPAPAPASAPVSAPAPAPAPAPEPEPFPEPRDDDRAMPDLEGDPDEFVSMFGMKVKRGQFDKLGDLTYKPGGSGSAVRSANRDGETGHDDDSQPKKKKKKKKTGLLKRVARKLTDGSKM